MSKPRYHFVHPTSPDRNYVHSDDMKQLLGIKRGLPREGMTARQLVAMDREQGHTVGVQVWVTPLVPKFRKGWNGHEYTQMPVKSSTHRVRCACPGCGAVLSAGRLFQHVCPPVAPDLEQLAREIGAAPEDTQDRDDAFNKFCDAVINRMNGKQRADWASWSLKATEQEIVDEALRILGFTRTPATDREFPEGRIDGQPLRQLGDEE